MIRYDPEASWNAYRVVRGWSMNDVRKALGGDMIKGSAHERHRPGSGPIDPEAVNPDR
jgi:hypothetical protein